MSEAARWMPLILNELIEAAKADGEGEVRLDCTLRCRLGAFELATRKSFNVTNSKTHSVVACDLRRIDPAEAIGSVVVKTIEAPGGILVEQLFHATLGERVEVEGLRIPRLLAANGNCEGTRQLFFEHLVGLSLISSMEQRCAAALVMGRFAGHCHAARLYETEWLAPRDFAPQLHHLVGFDGLVAMLPVSAAERMDILASFAGLLDRVTEFDAAYARELPTICHGDPYRRNLYALGDGFAAIDWEKVNAGRIGDDLGKMAFQLIGADEPDFESTEAKLLAAYAEGVAPFVPGDPRPSIARVYRLRSIIVSIDKADLKWRWAKSVPHRDQRRQRLRQLAERYRLMARRAREAAEELAG